MSKKVYYRTK